MKKTRTYSDLIKLNTFKDRFEYLMLDGIVGEDTFGFDRYLNQVFYKSSEWKKVRREVIVRDQGCDLGIDGEEIYGKIIVHHMNPIRLEDISNRLDIILNPEYLITVSMDTHNAIHFGDRNYPEKFTTVERTSNDTCPWKR